MPFSTAQHVTLPLVFPNVPLILSVKQGSCECPLSKPSRLRSTCFLVFVFCFRHLSRILKKIAVYELGLPAGRTVASQIVLNPKIKSRTERKSPGSGQAPTQPKQCFKFTQMGFCFKFLPNPTYFLLWQKTNSLPIATVYPLCLTVQLKIFSSGRKIKLH